MGINFVNNPSDVRDWMDWVTSIGAGIAAFAAVIATIAAWRAAHFAKMAWGSQVDQEINTRNQLRIAQDQEERALQIHNRERRARSPDWSLFPMDEGNSVVFLSHGDQYHSKKGYGFWEISLVPDALDHKVNRWVLPLIDRKNPGIEIRRCRAWFTEENEVEVVEFQSHSPLINSRAEGPGLMMVLKREQLPDRATDFYIRFETQDGFLDTQKFLFRVNLVGDVIVYAELDRVDPGSV